MWVGTKEQVFEVERTVFGLRWDDGTLDGPAGVEVILQSKREPLSRAPGGTEMTVVRSDVTSFFVPVETPEQAQAFGRIFAPGTKVLVTVAVKK